MMRIITGRAKGIRLETLEGDNTRPTAERVKEAVFSAIQFDIEGRVVLDLFAGSGQMGLEALSRGAERAVLCDHSKSAVGIIKKNVFKTKLEGAYVACADFAEFLRSFDAKKNGKYDIVFLDPPYAEKVIPKALTLLIENDLIKPTTIIVCESGSDADVFGANHGLSEKFETIKSKKHGVAYINILTPKHEEDESDE